MRLRNFALIYGVVNALLGLMGMVPGITTSPPAGAPPMMDSTHGYMMGIFPTNMAHNIEHLVVGLAGIAVFRSFGASRIYAWIATVLFGLKAVMGLIPGANSMFGMMPMWGADVPLHLVLALAAGYFAIVVAARERHEASSPTYAAAKPNRMNRMGRAA